MTDFVGADDLSFTAEEREAIRRAARTGQPQAEPRPPHHRPMPRAQAMPVHFDMPVIAVQHGRLPVLCMGALAAVLIVHFISFVGTLSHHASDAVPSGRVAIARKAVHLREQPNVHAPSLGVIPAGDVLTVEDGFANGFERVRYREQAGYVAKAYLATSSGVELIANTESRVAAIAGLARLREQPSLAGATIAALPASSPVTLMGFTPNGWCLVWTGTRAGFLWGGLLEPNSALPFRPRQQGAERVVQYCRRVLRP